VSSGTAQADGKRLHALAPDPNTAHVVRRIFAEYLAGRGLKAIAEGLTSDDMPSPSAYDPKRNSHRCGIAWSYGAVRAILDNPRYTGRQVWNKQPKSEQLIDVNDVALGHATKQTWNEPGKWIWSKETVHQSLIDTGTFEQVQALHRAKGSADERTPRRTPRAYALRGIVRCGICGRKMQGSWNNGKSHYRCTFLSQYAAKNKISHPTSVYLREELLLAKLDAWLARKLDPVAFTSALRAYEAGRPGEPQPDQSAQQEIAEYDAKLRQHRAALEAGADPVLVTSWMKETQARRALAEARLKKPAARRRMTEEEITGLVTEMGSIMRALEDADPADKAEIYQRLGLTLTYHPQEKRVAAEARPNSIMYVRECPRGDCTKKPIRRTTTDQRVCTLNRGQCEVTGLTGLSGVNPPSRHRRGRGDRVEALRPRRLAHVVGAWWGVRRPGCAGRAMTIRDEPGEPAHT
jgi:site-specific DNA recombinase